MAERKNRYKQMEGILSIAIIADAILFLGFLICAGCGVTWAKVFLAILCVLLSAGTLAVLYMTKELLRGRSIWMTLAAGAVLVCLLFSLLLNYPSPNPRKYMTDSASASVAVMDIDQM